MYDAPRLATLWLQDHPASDDPSGPRDQMNRQFWRWLGIGLAVAVLSTLITLAGTFGVSSQQNAFLDRAKRVVGTTTGVGGYTGKYDDPWAEVEFVAFGGETVIADVDWIDIDSTPAGTALEVLYDPGSPHGAQLEDHLDTGPGEYFQIFGAIGLAVGLGMTIHRFWWRRSVHTLLTKGRWFHTSLGTAPAGQWSSLGKHATLVAFDQPVPVTEAGDHVVPIAKTQFTPAYGSGQVCIAQQRRVIVRDENERLLLGRLARSEKQQARWYCAFDPEA